MRAYADSKNQTVFASVFDLSSEYEKYDYAATRTSSKADKYTDSDGSSAFSDSSTEKAATQLKEAAGTQFTCFTSTKVQILT